jgi:hypothetical protein
MKKLLSALIVAVALMSGAAHAANPSDPTNSVSPLTAEQAAKLLHEGKPVYSCSMKTTWFSDKPGQCPCCTLDLEKVKEIKGGQAVLEGNAAMPMDMKGMDMKTMETK